MRFRGCCIALLAVAPACGLTSSDTPMGLALIRVSEIAGPCPVTDHTDYSQLPTTLPYRRAKATAAFRASTSYPGGHYIEIGYQGDDGHIGMIQMEVPKERGYGIDEYATYQATQSIGFAEWKDGALDFAGTDVVGYSNYFGAAENTSDLPGTVFALVGFWGKDAANNDACRIVAVHASAERERVTPYDPSWLQPRPGLLIVTQNGSTLPPSLADVPVPGDQPVAPSDAPGDPGSPAPPMTLHGANAFSSGDGGSSPCD